MMKLPWRTIFVPIIMVLHFIPFYFLVVKYDESPQIQKEEIKNEKAEEESVEFEDEEFAETEELLEDEYIFSQGLAVVNELINDKQPFSKKNADAQVQNHPAGLEKDHKTREKHSANTPSSTSDTKEEQPAEQQTFKNSLHASYSDNSVATPEEYQKYYESYINTYTLDGKENGMPRLSLDVPDPVRHKEILHRMGFRLIIRPRFSPTCEPDPVKHAFHIAITGIGIEKRNTLPSGFALSALSSERNYCLKTIKNYPWYSGISDIPLEVVYYPEETGYKRYILGKMTQVIRDAGLRQQEVLELLGVIKQTVSGKFILLVTEITVREDDRGYKKLRYFDKDESRFRFVS